MNGQTSRREDDVERMMQQTGTFAPVPIYDTIYRAAQLRDGATPTAQC